MFAVFGIAPAEMLIFTALLLVPLILSWRRRATSPVLVLQKFTCAIEAEPQDDSIVEIVGRPQGIVAFILTSMGLDATTTLSVNRLEVTRRSTSLFRQEMAFIPLCKVSSLGAGVQKPINCLIIAAVLLVGGLLYTLMSMLGPLGSLRLDILSIAIIIAAVLVVIYFFSKRLFIEFHSEGDTNISMTFKPSAIEGIPVDIEQALMMIAVVRELILDANVVIHQERPPELPKADSIVSDSVIDSKSTFVPVSPISAPSSSDEATAKVLLSSAKKLHESGKRNEAIKALQQLIERYPSTKAAATAKRFFQTTPGTSDS